MLESFAKSYRRTVLEHPRTALAILCLLLGFLGFQTRHFELDASAEALLLEDDRDLQLYREVSARYRTQGLLVVTFTPPGDLFGDMSLQVLHDLRGELRAVEGVDSVMTILDAPLVKSSDIPLLELANNVQTLESEGIDRARAMAELRESPVFRDLLVSRDLKTAAILLNMKRDEAFAELQETRNELLIRRGAQGLTPEEQLELPAVSAAYEVARDDLGDRRHEDIAKVRGILERYRSKARLHLGGESMIADDMVTFVRNDLIVFGAGVFVFSVIVLAAIFRQPRWVILPLVSCFYAGVAMIGILGLVGWEVTVISSNFLALMLIITISMNIHLSVRYRQLHSEGPDDDHVDLVDRTVRRMVAPCLYTALTTIIGFGSLVFSQIKPVQDFGWMMSAGLSVAFLTSFTLFPASLVLLPRGKAVQSTDELPFTAALARMTERHGSWILGIATLLLLISLAGVSRLTVENAFISYFRDSTEIYQGMELIDRKLGGTTPLDILISFEDR
ncbi:MAG: MMPL family transporter, partial [bacterium]|nr:MMPL family transporter [bacterium]